MTALAAELMVSFEKWTRKQLPLLNGKKAYKGGTCMARPSAFAVVPGVTGAGAAGANDLFLGLFAETIDNTAGSVPILVNVDFLDEKLVLWRANDGSITAAANLFADAYVVDDQTVSATSTNRAKLGLIVAVDAVMGVAVFAPTVLV